MTSKTSCFDRTLFHKTLRRFWPLWTAYLALWLLTLVLPLHIRLTAINNILPVYRAQQSIYNALCYTVPFLIFGMAPLAAMAVFSYLYNPKRAVVFASLPVRREHSFLSLMLAGLVPMLAVPLLTAVFVALTELSAGCFEWAPLLTFAGIAVLMTLNFYGFAALCAQLTGHLLIVPAVYAVLSFTAPVVELLATSLVAMFVYGYQARMLGLGSYLSPLSAIMHFSATMPVESKEALRGWEYYGWEVNAAYAAVGLVCLVLALLLYRRRRIETAGDVVAVRPLKKIFAFALGGGCALVLSALLAVIFFDTGHSHGSRFVVVAIGLIVGGFIGYFGAEMLMRKTFRVFGAAWRGFAALFAVLMILLCAMRFDLLGWERNLPKAADVKSVYIHSQEYDVTLTDAANIEAVLRLNENILAHRAKSGDLQQYVRVSYDLGGDRDLQRLYDRVPGNYEDDPAAVRIAEELNAIFNTDEAIAQRFPTDVKRTQFHYTYVDYAAGDGVDHTLELSPEEAYAWYTTCILPDVADGTLGRADVASDTQEYQVYCRLDIYDDAVATGLFEYTRKNYYSIRINPTSKSVRTTQWLNDRGVTLKPAEW